MYIFEVAQLIVILVAVLLLCFLNKKKYIFDSTLIHSPELLSVVDIKLFKFTFNFHLKALSVLLFQALLCLFLIEAQRRLNLDVNMSKSVKVLLAYIFFSVFVVSIVSLAVFHCSTLNNKKKLRRSLSISFPHGVISDERMHEYVWVRKQIVFEAVACYLSLSSFFLSWGFFF